MTSPAHRFRPRTDAELYAMPPELLLNYVAAAKRAGEIDHAKTGMHMLIFRSEDRVRARVRLRLPEHLRRHHETVADWVLERILRSALRLQLDGESIGEWYSWIDTALRRQLISYWRSTQGQALERESMLPSEHDDEEGVYDYLGVPFDEERFVTDLDVGAASNTVLEGMANETHVEVIRRVYWGDESSGAVSTALGLSVANVDQVTRRFRVALRTELERRGVTGHV